MLTQEQIDELYEFEKGLSQTEEWHFFHLAWAGKDRVTNEDKYEVMQKWDSYQETDNDTKR